MDYSVHDLIRYIVRQAEQTELFTYEEKLCLMRIGCQLRVLDSKGLGNKTQILGGIAQMILEL